MLDVGELALLPRRLLLGRVAFEGVGAGGHDRGDRGAEALADGLDIDLLAVLDGVVEQPRHRLVHAAAVLEDEARHLEQVGDVGHGLAFTGLVAMVLERKGEGAAQAILVVGCHDLPVAEPAWARDVGEAQPAPPSTRATGP